MKPLVPHSRTLLTFTPEIRDTSVSKIPLNEFDLREEFLKPEPVGETILLPIYGKDTKETTHRKAQLTKPA